MSKKPMKLEDLPEYLNNHKNLNGFENVVVDMGQIVPDKKPKWPWVTALLIILFVGGGFASYAYIGTSPEEQMTIVVNTTNSVQELESIVSDNGGEVIAIKQNPNLTYEIQVSTKNKSSFLEGLKKNKNIKAELKE